MSVSSVSGCLCEEISVAGVRVGPFRLRVRVQEMSSLALRFLSSFRVVLFASCLFSVLQLLLIVLFVSSCFLYVFLQILSVMNDPSLQRLFAGVEPTTGKKSGLDLLLRHLSQVQHVFAHAAQDLSMPTVADKDAGEEHATSKKEEDLPTTKEGGGGEDAGKIQWTREKQRQRRSLAVWFCYLWRE